MLVLMFIDSTFKRIFLKIYESGYSKSIFVLFIELFIDQRLFDIHI